MKLRFWAGIDTLGGGDFFQVGLTPCMKVVTMNLKQQKIYIYISIVISTTLHFWHQPWQFTVVFICILIFLRVYSLHPQIPFLGKGVRAFSFKAINDQSFKHKNSWWQNYLFHVCMLTFFSFISGIFSLRSFLSVQLFIETLKKVFTIVW